MKLTLIGIAGIYCLMSIALYFSTRRGFNMSNPLKKSRFSSSTKNNSEKQELTSEENLLFFFVCVILLTDLFFKAIGVKFLEKDLTYPL